jgi:hypothetical protein
MDLMPDQQSYTGHRDHFSVPRGGWVVIVLRWKALPAQSKVLSGHPLSRLWSQDGQTLAVYAEERLGLLMDVDPPAVESELQELLGRGEFRAALKKTEEIELDIIVSQQDEASPPIHPLERVSERSHRREGPAGSSLGRRHARQPSRSPLPAAPPLLHPSRHVRDTNSAAIIYKTVVPWLNFPGSQAQGPVHVETDRPGVQGAQHGADGDLGDRQVPLEQVGNAYSIRL